VVNDDDAPDRELLERARTGDDGALGTLLSRHREVAYRVALGVLHDEDGAADAVQDAFLKALRGLAGFRGESRFRTWLLSIVVNEARGGLRRAARRGETPLGPVPGHADARPGADEVLERREQAERARASLARLPEKQRLSVQLRVDEGLSFREVGEVIGSSEGAARVNYHHGIRRLRELMREGP
jgi:RNA polymerase sigma-70 factor (ECF subfamily)